MRRGSQPYARRQCLRPSTSRRGLQRGVSSSAASILHRSDQLHTPPLMAFANDRPVDPHNSARRSTLHPRLANSTRSCSIASSASFPVSFGLIAQKKSLCQLLLSHRFTRPVQRPLRPQRRLRQELFSGMSRIRSDTGLQQGEYFLSSLWVNGKLWIFFGPVIISPCRERNPFRKSTWR